MSVENVPAEVTAFFREHILPSGRADDVFKAALLDAGRYVSEQHRLSLPKDRLDWTPEQFKDSLVGDRLLGNKAQA